MRPSILAILLAALLVAGCVGPTLDAPEYRQAATDSLERTRDRLDAARLTAAAAGRGRATKHLVATTIGELEHAAAYARDAFATRQPPPGSGAVRAEALPLLQDAAGLLADVRIVAFRGDHDAVGAYVDELDALARDLEDRAAELRP